MPHELFPNHTRDTAPSGALPVFDAAEQQFRMIPNLVRKMATSPALASAYLALSALYERCSLTPVERQVVLLAISRYHGCGYCVGAHSVLADMAGVPESVTDALRDARPIEDPRLEAVRRFAIAMVERRGHVDKTEVDAFLEAGYQPEDVLSVILAIGLKTLSNYTNHVAGTELDAAFSHRAWQPPT